MKQEGLLSCDQTNYLIYKMHTKVKYKVMISFRVSPQCFRAKVDHFHKTTSTNIRTMNTFLNDNIYHWPLVKVDFWKQQASLG